MGLRDVNRDSALFGLDHLAIEHDPCPLIDELLHPVGMVGSGILGSDITPAAYGIRAPLRAELKIATLLIVGDHLHGL